jgi:hypothetical protein
MWHCNLVDIYPCFGGRIHRYCHSRRAVFIVTTMRTWNLPKWNSPSNSKFRLHMSHDIQIFCGSFERWDLWQMGRPEHSSMCSFHMLGAWPLEIWQVFHLQWMSQWRVGAPCCAVYSGDGVIYEATIDALFHDRGTCLVKYVGKWKVYAHMLPPGLTYISKSGIFSLVIECLFIFEIHDCRRAHECVNKLNCIYL